MFVISTTNVTCPFDGKEHISNENLIICSFAVKVSKIIFVFFRVSLKIKWYSQFPFIVILVTFVTQQLH